MHTENRAQLQGLQGLEYESPDYRCQYFPDYRYQYFPFDIEYYFSTSRVLSKGAAIPSRIDARVRVGEGANLRTQQTTRDP